MDSIYSTAFHIIGSFYDVQIEFAKMEPVLESNGTIKGNERIPQQRVTLPVAVAKDLAQKLHEAVESYEKAFGEVRVPQQTTPR